MDALSAPRGKRKTDTPQQTKMRGLGIEESDSKSNTESIPSRFPEAAKPRGIVSISYLSSVSFGRFDRTYYIFRGTEFRANND